MIIKLESLTQAINKVKDFASSMKEVPGILLDFTDTNEEMDLTTKLKVCFSDGRRGVIDIIDINREPEDKIDKKIVVPYATFINMLDICQPVGIIQVGEFRLTFNEESKVINISATKVVSIENDEDVQTKTISKFDRQMKYSLPEENLKTSILTRMQYDEIFNIKEEDCDYWNKSELIKLLNRTVGEDNKITYISHKEGGAFVINLAYATYVPNDTCNNAGFTIYNKLSNAITDIISRMNGDTVGVWVKEKRYVNIVSEDNKCGIMFEMPAGVKMDYSTLMQYKDREYNSYKIYFNRLALSNVLQSVSATDKNERTDLCFKTNEEGVYMKLVTSGNGSSIASEFEILAEESLSEEGKIDDLKLPVNLKVITDMVDNCNEPYIALDIDKSENSTYIRISEYLGKDRIGACHWTVAFR